MAEQTYKTHAHRPVATTVGFFFVAVAFAAFVMRWNGTGGRTSFAIGLLGVLGAEITLLSISRTHITKLQDRIIRLEMRVRLAPLLTPEQQRMYGTLGVKQIVALRFASDVELPELLERAVRERLSPDDIKRAIKTWVPDHDRT